MRNQTGKEGIERTKGREGKGREMRAEEGSTGLGQRWIWQVWLARRHMRVNALR